MIALGGPLILSAAVKTFSTAILIVWGISGIVLLVPLASPYLLSESEIFAITPVCVSMELYGESCFLCGMTRGFIEISRGNLEKAREFNVYSVALYGAFAVNEIALAVLIGYRAITTVMLTNTVTLGRGIMQILSLIMGILSLVVMFVGFVPCFGSLNWLNIPFAAVGLVIGIIALANAREGSKGASIAGVVLCAIALVLGALRLMVGGGIF